MNSGDKLLIGFDMIKPLDVLESAYNDSKGVTEQFNKNILAVVNNELNGNFNRMHFTHKAFFNESASRIEMHLQVNRACSVWIEDIEMKVELEKGDSIHTENSHKFTREMITELAGKAELTVENWYTDPQNWFSVMLMTPA
jgi:L-histidine N-alpha-methyltransferase